MLTFLKTLKFLCRVSTASTPAQGSTELLQRASVSLPSVKPSQSEIEVWVQSSNPLVANLSKKLKKRVAGDDPAELAVAVSEAIGWFLQRENTLESIRTTAPELHEGLIGAIARRTERLRLYGPPPEGTAHNILRTEIQELIAELQREVRNFTSASAQEIALGTIAEWLLRCPLDFPPYDHA